MSTLMARAVDDCGPINLRGLYRRFVAWTLPEDTRCRLCGRRGHDATPGIPPRLMPCDEIAENAGRATWPDR